MWREIKRHPGMLAGALIGAAVMAWAMARAWPGGEARPAISIVSAPPRALPDFKLVSQAGKPFGLADLKGKVWVASFVYSSCKTSCPMLGQQMKRLQDLIPGREDFRLVSITVDPRRDNPSQLSAYARQLGATEGRWYFLTGGKSQIARVVGQVFQVPGEPGVRHKNAQGDLEVLHSTMLVLVDKAGKVRGYFDGVLSEDVEKLKASIHALLEEG